MKNSMNKPLQTKTASQDKTVIRLHKWRVSMSYGRAKTVNEIEEKVGLKISVRTLEDWEQGRTLNLPKPTALVIEQFLKEVKG